MVLQSLKLKGHCHPLPLATFTNNKNPNATYSHMNSDAYCWAGRAFTSSQGQPCVVLSACFHCFSFRPSSFESGGGSIVQLVAREITEGIYLLVRIRKGKPYFDLNFFTGQNSRCQHFQLLRMYQTEAKNHNFHICEKVVCNELLRKCRNFIVETL